jgi:hypothetical protein
VRPRRAVRARYSVLRDRLGPNGKCQVPGCRSLLVAVGLVVTCHLTSLSGERCAIGIYGLTDP